MQLLILRHAEAETRASTDEARRLTDTGRQQAEAAARFVVERRLIPDLLLTSPLTRARETAAIVAAACGMSADPADFLKSGMRPGTALEELGAYAQIERLMIVGHEPDLSSLVVHLLGAQSGVRVRKAALLGMHVRTFAPGGGVLDFSLPVKWMTPW
ncbi:MAG TPA: histidine phosphatase family protein [Chthoniobacteraceae bacterium]|nr:histidine phosphatase family protein [Chthoniobacteraceae bacterium]